MSPIGYVAVGLALGLAAGLCARWLRGRRRGGEPSAAPAGPADYADPRGPAYPVPFGPKCTWLAVRAESAPAVAEQLGLVEAQSASWAEGVHAGYQGRRSPAFAGRRSTVFVTPPVEGWVLVLGTTDRLEADELLTGLSARWGEAQRFATHRGASAGGWALARAGRVVRALAFGDGLVASAEGEPTAVERDLGLSRIPGEPGAPVAGDEEEPCLDEAEVLRVAAAWSLDPSTLEGRDGPCEPGVVGRLRAPSEPA